MSIPAAIAWLLVVGFLSAVLAIWLGWPGVLLAMISGGVVGHLIARSRIKAGKRP